ncbi:unnamed protein product [Spirodela intermedia]|uniref:Uncharacterized protein n=1 Tax=Spirodela intermedia TaxID=51605 RepID=A0A7I8JDC9_SPIIN|nr:unnamed protein product [Spirodela intermedia]CAA6668001.1 unnamed protein product [Spirodela intermedia]
MGGPLPRRLRRPPRRLLAAPPLRELLVRLPIRRPLWGPWPALYASALFGGLFGLLSMAAALAVAVPAMVVTWITVLVLLACAGKPRQALVREGRRATADIARIALKVLVREGKLVAAVCAVISFFALLYRRQDLHIPPNSS